MIALVHSARAAQVVIPAPPPSERRALPVLHLGEGDRREDCVEYSGCLMRFVRRASNRLVGDMGADRAAHCPTGCPSFASDREIELLHTAASRPGSFT